MDGDARPAAGSPGSSTPRYVPPEEVRAELKRIVGRMWRAPPLPKEGPFLLRGAGRSCQDSVPTGMAKLVLAAAGKVVRGSARAGDWTEIFTSVLAHYSMWLDAGTGTGGVLDPDAIYARLLWLRDGRLPSSDVMVAEAEEFFDGLRAVPLSGGAWSEDAAVGQRVGAHVASLQHCSCFERL